MIVKTNKTVKSEQDIEVFALCKKIGNEFTLFIENFGHEFHYIPVKLEGNKTRRGCFQKICDGEFVGNYTTTIQTSDYFIVLFDSIEKAKNNIDLVNTELEGSFFGEGIEVSEDTYIVRGIIPSGTDYLRSISQNFIMAQKVIFTNFIGDKIPMQPNFSIDFNELEEVYNFTQPQQNAKRREQMKLRGKIIDSARFLNSKHSETKHFYDGGSTAYWFAIENDGLVIKHSNIRNDYVGKLVLYTQEDAEKIRYLFGDYSIMYALLTTI